MRSPERGGRAALRTAEVTLTRRRTGGQERARPARCLSPSPSFAPQQSSRSRRLGKAFPPPLPQGSRGFAVEGLQPRAAPADRQPRGGQRGRGTAKRREALPSREADPGSVRAGGGAGPPAAASPPCRAAHLLKRTRPCCTGLPLTRCQLSRISARCLPDSGIPLSMAEGAAERQLPAPPAERGAGGRALPRSPGGGGAHPRSAPVLPAPLRHPALPRPPDGEEGARSVFPQETPAAGFAAAGRSGKFSSFPVDVFRSAPL